MRNLHARSIFPLSCLALAGVLALPLLAHGDGPPGATIGHAQAVVAPNGMVVAQEAIAARIGADILQAGRQCGRCRGRTGFAMAVTYPRAGNIGGGGFMMIHRADGEDVAIDYRETAPAAINAKSFLDATASRSAEIARLRARHRRARHGRGAGAGREEIRLRQIHARRSDRPAIALARDGFVIADDTRRHAAEAAARLARWPSSAKIFLKPTAARCRRATGWCRRDLAATLRPSRSDGPRGFYQGPIAEKIAAACATPAAS